jgi:DNA repair exonuclease SbcCD ATPase subunit
MSATQASSEPSLFDHSARESAKKPTTPTTPERAEVAEPRADVAEVEANGDADTETTRSDAVALSPEAIAQNERKRLAEQLEALKRKELEVRRALAAADHPEVADAIRAIETRANAVTRVEAKLAQGFSKTEARRREVIEKKLVGLRAKRAELDGQIAELETELNGLGAERLATFERERLEALEQLMIVMATHDAGLRAAKVDLAELIPEITRWLPELEAVAKKVSGADASLSA